jgi:oxygen-independent coproporphyrinogen-3 oxidase
MMAAAGLPPYEISNYAAQHEESRHNLTYWHYNDYIGIGAGAHGRFVQEGTRYATENHRNPDRWLQQVLGTAHGRAEETIIDAETAMREALMMGLRLTAGIDKAAWGAKFAAPLDDYVAQQKRSILADEGLILDDKSRLCATPDGLQRLNAVLGYLLT